MTIDDLNDVNSVFNEAEPDDMPEESAIFATKKIVKELKTSSKQELKTRILASVELIQKYGPIDGGHHKMWVLDQVLRTLLDKSYDDFVKEYSTDGYEWDEGIAP